MRRWRGNIDVPLTALGEAQANVAGSRLKEAGGLTLCYHDSLSRDVATARAVCHATAISPGPRPWKMGPGFEGHPITRNSILHANWFMRHRDVVPHGGESWGQWYSEWMSWLAWLGRPGTHATSGKIGVVTHNRNIVAVQATTETGFDPKLYDCDGPDFCEVYYYFLGKITPWLGTTLVPGIYLIRHGETSFGT